MRPDTPPTNLLVNATCTCIRSRFTGDLLALCARCRAAVDPEFARRCDPQHAPEPPQASQRKIRRVVRRKPQ
jgi:hypothetical protein